MARFRIQLFGYPSLAAGDQLARLERRKSLALLAYLAVESGERGRARETLAAIFWPDCAQAQAGAYLRQALWEIQKAAGTDLLRREEQRLTLAPDAWVDTAAFEDVLRRWKTSQWDAAASAAALAQAVALYRDDFLAGFSLPGCPDFDRWQALQSETLRAHLAQALEALAGLAAGRGDWDSAVEHARRWLDQDPLNEAAHRALMRIYLQSSQPAAARRQYEACRKVLEEELGVEPAAETQALRREAAGGAAPRPAAAAEERTAPAGRPTGTVTFLFTDIEGSTRLWQQFPRAMPEAFARQEAIFRAAVAAHGGYVYKMIGDAFQAAFSLAPAALAAAVAAQRALFAAPWGETGIIKVRMALHAGMTEERADDYVGPTLNRVARILSAGHGGQILLNRPAYELVRDCLPDDVTLRDMGECWLKDLESPEQLYQVVAGGLPDAFPPLRTARQPVAPLPLPPTPFVGREHELAHISSLFDNAENRLVTLVGIGGIGKTRLAIEAARRAKAQQGSYAHGVGFVGLTAAASLADIVAGLAQTVGLAFHTAPGYRLSAEAAQQQLFDYLSSRAMLLVLDNFEHLMDYAAFVADLLSTAPGLRLMVTSRLRLNLPGECVIEVSGLPFPGKRGIETAGKFAAVQLFLQGAGRVGQPALPEADLPAVGRICQLLEGMPLGVEMAAAWTKMLSCAEIAAEIERDLNFLVFDRRGMPERHRTLRAVFEHSWRLLAEDERSVLLHLAVFQGGFSREKAQEVADAPLTLLSSLMDQSFLRRLTSGRFEIHPVLRPFIVAKLEAAPDIHALLRARHASRFFGWLLEMHDRLKGPDQIAALTALRSEQQNLVEAWRYLIEKRDFSRLKCCLPAIILFEVMDDQPLDQAEIDRLLLNLLEALPGTPAEEAVLEIQNIRALTLAALRYASIRSGQPQQIAWYEQRSLEVIAQLPGSTEKANALLLNCIGPGFKPLHEKVGLISESKALFEQAGDRWSTALALMIRGDLATFGNQDVDPGTARAAYLTSLEVFAGLGNLWGRALCLVGLAFAEKQANHLAEAYRYGQEGLQILARLENPARQMEINHGLGEIAEGLGDPAAARQHFEANLAYFTEIGDLRRRDYYQERIAALAKAAAEERSLE